MKRGLKKEMAFLLLIYIRSNLSFYFSLKDIWKLMLFVKVLVS